MGAMNNLFLVVFLLLISMAAAEQPSLPTLAYGKVMKHDYTLAADVTVTATFINNDGQKQSISTKTLSEEMVGHYFFNRGYLQAKPGSEITISVGKHSVKTDASPGNLIEAPAIQLSSEESKSVESGKDPGSPGKAVGNTGFGTGESSAEVVADGRTKITLRQFMLMGLHELLGKIIKTDVPEGKGLDNTFRGYLSDEDGNPLPGEELTLNWTDENNKSHT